MQQLEEEIAKLKQIVEYLTSRIEALERNNHYRIPVQPSWPQPVYPYQPTPTYPHDITITCSDNTDWKVT